MNLNSIFKLDQIPVNFQPHQAVQRQIVLGELMGDNHDENIRVGNRLADSVNQVMLPLYLRSSTTGFDERPGFYVIPNAEPESFWRWAFQFVLIHDELEEMALTDPFEVQLLHHPFEALQANRLYVADEWGELSKINFSENSISAVQEFGRINPHLQLLNASVIMGDRSLILEFLSLMIRYTEQLEPAEQQNYFKVDQIFNFVCYSYFANRLVHGRQVTTIFGFEQQHSEAWFKCR
ncbi:hypothetical protein [Levilactobacillus bambusae]|uniref:Uncharacterized protein n=1 Tax=Levilactobacillus bambusae TaxID=2024736 RepID=A0A2V1MX41_9LACO|nr:hypothetical protein [Levilactobacillus bambusae]PWF99643.1 hypothetical protein DCM90_07445 [Levilactobacillus bambusae]